jgi:hypothetical protein
VPISIEARISSDCWAAGGAANPDHGLRRHQKDIGGAAMGVFVRVVVLTLVVFSVSADRVSAFEWFRRARTPGQQHMQFMGSQPGSQMYPEKVGITYPPYGPMQSVPTYDWGFFGARSGQTHSHHQGYYGDDRYSTSPRTF